MALGTPQLAVLCNVPVTAAPRQNGTAPPIGQVGGMVSLIKLLETRFEDSIIALSASAVAGLSVSATNADAFWEAGGVPNLVSLLKEDVGVDVMSAVLWATASLARHPLISNAMRDAGSISTLVELLQPLGSSVAGEELMCQAMTA
eukprot:CAMPEP_0177627168 /NCGR_PEP_ID=MMETSP0419_2-20121207/31056_1 /TAXON_ID=582737 /ORGANISM="Tetraselmis sp., Strain GSL018" /LENGTH=145 /DNA_ID=CAMNT_0019128297 /DNA_START=148 /DNA_END=582 /DNA_ORIENTATION=-